MFDRRVDPRLQRPSRVIFLSPFGFVLVLFPRTAASNTFVSSRVRFPPSQRPTQPPRPSRTFQKETNRPPPRCGTRRGSRSARSTTSWTPRGGGRSAGPPTSRAAAGTRTSPSRSPARAAASTATTRSTRPPRTSRDCALLLLPSPLYIFICLSSLQFDLMSLMWCHRICECDARL